MSVRSYKTDESNWLSSRILIYDTYCRTIPTYWLLFNIISKVNKMF